MGKKRGSRKAPNTKIGSQNLVSLREETSGKKQTKGGSTNLKSILKKEHLKKLAAWASGKASIPSLGAFFGHRLATYGEATGIPPDPSLFPCQRCETILQPGFNCTVRIEKNQTKARRKHKKPNTLTQNSVAYKCHFCSHRNLKRGTPRGHMKEICYSTAKPSSVLEAAYSMHQKSAGSEKHKGITDAVNKVDVIASPAVARDTPTANSPSITLMRTGTSLLEGKNRKRNRSNSKKPSESEGSSATIDAERTVSASSKRRRKSWTSLKEIAESSEHDSSLNVTNLTIPFFI